MIKFAVLLFPIDVGIRRIQIDSNEWGRWIFYLKRILIFWRPSNDNITQEESLHSPLTKRNKKRQELLQRQKINFNEPDSKLFEPQESIEKNSLKNELIDHNKNKLKDIKTKLEERSTASRLLEAKRNALRKKK